MKKDLYESITSEILDALDRGTVPWRMPWRRSGAENGLPMSITSRKAYRGLNVFLLALAGQVRGFECQKGGEGAKGDFLEAVGDY
jgi:antirestriction protein ArdC